MLTTACSDDGSGGELAEFQQLNSTTSTQPSSRVASDPFEADFVPPVTLPDNPLLHVLGSIRSLPETSSDWQADVAVVIDDVATVASLGCNPTDADCNPSDLLAWSIGGVDLINLATANAGLAGPDLEDVVLDIRSAGVQVVGYGEDLTTAIAGVTVETNNLTVAIYSISLTAAEETWATENSSGIAGANAFDALLQEVVDQRAEGIAVVVLVDSGSIDDRAPTEQQVADLQRLVEVDVDAIIGHGSDFIQRYDRVANSTISYSLGNAVTATEDPLRADSAVLRLEFAAQGQGQACLLPATSGPNGPALDDQTITTCIG